MTEEWLHDGADGDWAGSITKYKTRLLFLHLE